MTSPDRIWALLVGRMRRARDLDEPCPRIDLRKSPALPLTRRLVPLARHQQNRARDAGQCVFGQFGPRHAVLVQRRDQVAPVLGPMVGLVQTSQRERPRAVQMLEPRSAVVAGASRPRGDQDQRSGRSRIVQFQRQRDLRAVGETHDMRAAQVQVVDEIAQVRADRGPRRVRRPEFRSAVAAQVGQDAAIARSQCGGQVSPLEFAGRGRAVDEQDRLGSVADHRVCQRQPIVLIGEGTSDARLISHDFPQVTTRFSISGRPQDRRVVDEGDWAFISLPHALD